MNILVITAVYPPYQVPEADHVLHICDHLAKEGHEITVLTSERQCSDQLDNVKLLPIMSNWKWLNLIKVIRTLRNVKPEGVFLFFLASYYDHHPMISLTPVLMSLLGIKANFVVQFSNVSIQNVPKNAPLALKIKKTVAWRLGRFSYGFLLTHSNYILVMNQSHKEIILGLHKDLGPRIKIVPPPPLIRIADNSDAQTGMIGRKLAGLSNDDFVVSYFGRLYPEKGVEDALHVFSELAKNNKKAKLLMIGGYCTKDSWLMRDSYEDELNVLVKNLNIEDRIYWSGEYEWSSYLPSQLLSASDVCLLPFSNGVSLMNSSFSGAICHHLPVVSTVVGNLESPLADGENGIYRQPGDIKKLADALRLLMEDSALRNRLQAGAAQLAESRFSWKGAMQQTLEALEN